MHEVIRYPKDKSYGEYFNKVLRFLNKHNEDSKYIFFHWSRWEWMFARDSFKESDLAQIALFVKDGDIKGAIIFEDDPEDVYFAVYDDIKALKIEMIEYFKRNYKDKDIIIPQDPEMSQLLAKINYEKTDWIDPVTRFSLVDFEIPETPGYKIVSLDEDYRLDQIHHALYRGFNHGDDITYNEEDLSKRKHETSSPNFNKKYTYAAVHDNKFVAYAGVWYLPNSKSVLVEPVATVPEHRRKYLARACIYACIKAVMKDGAKNVFVGSNRDVYLNMGFKEVDYAIRYKKKL